MGWRDPPRELLRRRVKRLAWLMRYSHGGAGMEELLRAPVWFVALLERALGEILDEERPKPGRSTTRPRVSL